MASGKTPATVALDADLLDRFDALCRERGQNRDRAIEKMMRREVQRQARSDKRAPPGHPVVPRRRPLDPDVMILHAVALQEVARKLMDGEFASGRSHAHAVLLALAVEIALKAWQCRERKGGDPDHSHCLVKLFDRLSEDAQERLQTRMPEHPWPRGAEHARLSGNPFGGGIRVVLEAHRNTFEAWRYSYEHDALYTWPPQLDEALTAIIDTYNPLHVIRLPGLGNLVR